MKKLTPFILVFAVGLPLAAQVGQRGKRPLITRPIDGSQRHRLIGNTRPEATAANDTGAAAADLAMDHMLLQLQRSPEQEEALKQRIDDLQNPASPNYHKWLTPADFAREFAPAQSDVDA